ncbi:MAG: NDP-sugar synthase [Candidatus Saganbacteria bacterium]|nr:NDP-sugar synthase [Candidatus Saganbacteria bacterium]
MKAIIIAGGLGTRLRPLTYNRPKPMVPVMNKPFIVHQIELLKKFGITEIILNLHYLSDNMALMLGDGADLGVKLFYSIEKNPLGTAGAVKNAEEYLDKDDIVVFNGDVLADFNIAEIIAFHKEKKAKVTLTLTSVEDPTPFGLVLADESGRVTKFVEKPSWQMVTAKTINAGLYVMNPSVFKSVPKGRPYSFERELFPKLLDSGEKVYAVVSKDYWLDIGSPQKYMQAHRDILNGDIHVVIDGERVGGNIWIAHGSVIDPSAKLHGPLMVGKNANISSNARLNQFSVIGENVRILEGAYVEDSVILRNSIIGKDVKLKDCIIGENCIIEDFAEVGMGVVLADYSIVKKGSKLA